MQQIDNIQHQLIQRDRPVSWPLLIFPGVRYGAYNYLTGVPEAACALDIAGAIAWMTQIATFVQQLGPLGIPRTDFPEMLGTLEGNHPFLEWFSVWISSY